MSEMLEAEATLLLAHLSAHKQKQEHSAASDLGLKHTQGKVRSSAQVSKQKARMARQLQAQFILRHAELPVSTVRNLLFLPF